jgi:hypothetical protein
MAHDSDPSAQLAADLARHIAYLHEHHPDAWARWQAHPTIAGALERVWSASDFVATSCTDISDVRCPRASSTPICKRA